MSLQWPKDLWGEKGGLGFLFMSNLWEYLQIFVIKVMITRNKYFETAESPTLTVPLNS